MKRILLCIITITAVGLEANAQWSQITPNNFDSVTYSSIAFADINGDNDQDVLITGENSANQPIAKLYTNNGSGSFTELIGTPFEGVYHGSIAFADVDGDNDQDVLITGENSANQPIAKLYTNNGSGSFTELIGTPFEGVRFSSIAFADVDGDNDQDVLITGFNSSSQSITKLYTNNGGGTFAELTGTPFDGVFRSSIAFVDVDGDNDQDVLITGQNSSQQKIAKLYTNNGSGTFTELAGTPFEGVRYGSVAFADIDSDNDQDLLITGQDTSTSNQPIAKLYTNNGSGSFTELIGTPFVGVNTSSIAFADIDSDNDQDVLITGYDGTQTTAKLYTNNGSGSFTELIGLPFTAASNGSIAFADIDGDSDQDLLITGRNTSSQISSTAYRNISTVGISENINDKMVNIYPNPATNQITIDSNEKIETIAIMDAMGKTVKTIISTNNTIDVSNLTKGIYFLQIQTDKGLASKKFIKE